MTDDPFAPLDLELGHLLANLDPAQRRKAALRIARTLRRSQADRIAANRNPDGSPFAPRRPREETGLRGRRGAVRRGAMFRKIRTGRWLTTAVTDEEAAIFFTGAASRIARVHQLGLRDRVGRSPGSPETVYAERRLLGFTPEDRALVLGIVAEMIEQA